MSYSGYFPIHGWSMEDSFFRIEFELPDDYHPDELESMRSSEERSWEITIGETKEVTKKFTFLTEWKTLIIKPGEFLFYPIGSQLHEMESPNKEKEMELAELYARNRERAENNDFKEFKEFIKKTMEELSDELGKRYYYKYKIYRNRKGMRL
jgi:hypothetical protein